MSKEECKRKKKPEEEVKKCIEKKKEIEGDEESVGDISWRRLELWARNENGYRSYSWWLK